MLSTGGVDNTDTLFIVVKRGDGITTIANLQTLAHVFRHNPRLGCRDGVAEVGEKRRRGAKLFFHFVEAGDVGFLDTHGLGRDVRHRDHHEPVFGKQIHGAFFALGIRVLNGRKVALVKLL